MNLVPKRQNLAAKLADLATSLMDTKYELDAAVAEYTKAGLTFVDTDFSGEDGAALGLSHLDAATVTGAITSFSAISTFISANFHDTNLEKARR